MTMSDQVEDALIALGAFAGFWVVFGCTWMLSTRYGQHTFEQYTAREKAEWCARICSTVHASIVIPGVIACLIENKWSSDNIAFTSPQTCRAIFSVSIGYFCQDLIAIVRWRLDHWKEFVVHHLVALTPYCINNFVPGCHCGNYVLALFLLVEIPTLPLNAVGTMDQLGMRKTNARYGAFLVMYALWFLARILLPIYLLVVLYEIIIPSWYSERDTEEFAICVVPSAVCANIIAFFCFYIFLTQLSVDLFQECIRTGHASGGGNDPLKLGAPPTPLGDEESDPHTSASSRSPGARRFGRGRGRGRGTQRGGGAGGVAGVAMGMEQRSSASSAASGYGALALGEQGGAAGGGGEEAYSSSDDEFFGITQMFRRKQARAPATAVRQRNSITDKDESVL